MLKLKPNQMFLLTHWKVNPKVRPHKRQTQNLHLHKRRTQNPHLHKRPKANHPICPTAKNTKVAQFCMGASPILEVVYQDIHPQQILQIHHQSERERVRLSLPVPAQLLQTSRQSREVEDDSCHSACVRVCMIHIFRLFSLNIYCNQKCFIVLLLKLNISGDEKTKLICCT